MSSVPGDQRVLKWIPVVDMLGTANRAGEITATPDVFVPVPHFKRKNHCMLQSKELEPLKKG